MTELLKWNLVFLISYHDSLEHKRCVRVLLKETYFFDGIPDEFKTQEMCEKAVETRPTLFFEDVPDYFVTPKMLELCEYAITEEDSG